MLTGKAKEDFGKYKKWYFIFLPKHIKYLIIFRWFNCHAIICIDIKHWIGDGFNFAVTHPFKDEVYVSNEKGGQRTKSFELNIIRAIKKADEIYNSLP